jgi:hypothetical protein
VKRHSKKVRKERKTAEILLKNLEKALNACENKKVHVKLQQGIVVSRYGYVLPFKKGWEVRMLLPSRYNDDSDD